MSTVDPMTIGTAIAQTLDAVTPLLSDGAQHTIHLSLEGGEDWTALEYALRGAVAEGIDVPAEVLVAIATAVNEEIDADRLAAEGAGIVVTAVRDLRRVAR